MIRFVTPPPVSYNINAHWVLYPSNDVGGVLIGDPCNIQDDFLDRDVWYLDVSLENVDKSIGDIIRDIIEEIKKNVIIYITDSLNSNRKDAIHTIGCFMKTWMRLDSFEDIIVFFNNILKTRLCFGQGYMKISLCDKIRTFERPLVVLVCGDRNSSTSFEDLIRFELKCLPEGSVIVHGACYGIDMCAHNIASELRLKTKPYPAEWDKYGKAAGPIRNRAMLCFENPNLVLAFHPDIECSKGTKNMILQAYNYGYNERKPEIYVNSLKRKTNLRDHFNKYGYGNFKDI